MYLQGKQHYLLAECHSCTRELKTKKVLLKCYKVFLTYVLVTLCQIHLSHLTTNHSKHH